MSAEAQSIELKRYRSPKTVIGRFVARRTYRSALVWAIVFGIYVASKAIGFVDLYPTAAARQKIAETFSNNIGIELLLGKAPHAATTASYVAWNCANVMVVIGAIWALLLATKYFRGEEESGRQEILLSGQTTGRQAAANILLGLGSSLCVFYIISAALFAAVGKSHGVDYNSQASIFFALAVTLGIAMFMMIGALASQLFPTRSRAASVTAVILGICFVMRAIGDITSMHWLSNINPLGWVEKLQPLAITDHIWLIPILSLIAILIILTVYFAGRRDLGDSTIADKPTAKPRLSLLNSPIGLATRLYRANYIGWLIGISLVAILYGLITKSTAQVFSQSASFEKVLNRLAQQTNISSALSFLGIVFFLQMVIIMVYAVNSVAAIRRDEAEGYLDNFLVRPLSRKRWLAGRLLLIGIVIVLAGLLTTFGVWLGVASQHMGLPFHTLLLAGINALVPAVISVGVGIFALGIAPRITTMAAYAVLVWSFLIEMVSSGLNLNHWILDTSVLHQVSFAPAANPKWTADLIIVILAALLCIVGGMLFNNRDLEVE